MTRESYQYGTLVQVGPTWFIRYRERTLRGDVIHRSEKVGSVEQFPTRAKAERAAEGIIKRINERKPVVTFSELADRYVDDVLPTLRVHTRVANVSNLRHLRAKFDARRLDEITPGEVQLWLNELKSLKGKELARNTRKNIRNLAHNLWRHAMLWGYISPQVNPIEIVRVTKGTREKPRSTVTVDADVYRKLLDDPELLPVAKMMVRVAMTTGMGVSEILGLKWDDSIDFRKGVIHVIRSVVGKDVQLTKNEFRENDVPMHPDLADALLRWKREPSWGGWVFGSPQTERPYHAGIMLTDHLKPAARRAGCPGLGWHSFRHTFSVALELAGASDRVQQRSMRHGDGAMTKHYGKHSPALFEKARQAQAKVMKKLKTGTEE